MNDAEDYSLSDPDRPGPNGGDLRPRAVGSPLPMGSSGRAQMPPFQSEAQQFPPVPPPPPGRALVNSSAQAQGDLPASLQRIMGALRMAMPFVHKILPILDGNFASAVSNILTPHPHPPTPMPPPANLAPIEEGLAELQSQHRDLRQQIVDQNSSLKRVEDQLEMVREATDRNTLEQQELLEDLKTVGNKVNVFALILLGLLAVSILLNVILLVHLQRVLP